MTDNRSPGASPRPAGRAGPPGDPPGVRPELLLGAVLAATMLFLGAMVWIAFPDPVPSEPEVTTQIRTAPAR